VGRIPVRWHRPLEGDIKTVRISKKAGTWYAAFSCVVPDPEPLPASGTSIGIDVGLTHLLTTSEGKTIDNPRWYRTEQAKLRIIQRCIARRTKGGSNRKRAVVQVQRQHERIGHRRKDYLNKLVHRFITTYDLIAIEDLRITNMTRNHHLSKSILDAGWGYLADHLTRKAACAGREVCLVDPAYTSKTCSTCGERFEQKITLSVRWVTCGACGLSLDRDHNAAINILRRACRALDRQPAGTPPLGVNVTGLPVCVVQEAAPF